MTELTSETEVCLALGYFDSVHLGHRSLIAVARDYARKNGVVCAVATFSNNAYKLFNINGKQVYTYSERCKLLEPLCDCVLPMRFDTRLKNRTAETFLDGLFSHYRIKAVVCGYDYLFGAGAKGDAELLNNYCKAHGVECIVVDKFELNGMRVSTTVVKDFLADGQIEKANEYLGAPFMMSGKVVHGRGAGRLFDIPTANIKLPSSKIVPASGVYGTTCIVDDAVYYGATNVGARPTFGLTKTVVETMLDGFNDSIYGKDVTLFFHKKLRSVTKFDTPALLSKQVRADIKWRDNA
ncbi:MAG: riboflavin biosynthesis protein RibF [Roseburia sp.]|nr:riboflavin biosynthesis protein RibF [Roseburia sp.]